MLLLLRTTPTPTNRFQDKQPMTGTWNHKSRIAKGEGGCRFGHMARQGSQHTREEEGRAIPCTLAPSSSLMERAVRRHPTGRDPIARIAAHFKSRPPAQHWVSVHVITPQHCLESLRIPLLEKCIHRPFEFRQPLCTSSKIYFVPQIRRCLLLWLWLRWQLLTFTRVQHGKQSRTTIRKLIMIVMLGFRVDSPLRLSADVCIVVDVTFFSIVAGHKTKSNFFLFLLIRCALFL